MKNNVWDPLQQNDDENIIAGAKKREIKNILKSYVGSFDPFAELIQNSMDAVDIRASRLNEHDYKKQIWIKIDIPGNSFSISDNGIGFNASEFKGFLAPNISFKEGSRTRGQKGVGSTYIAFGFNYLQMGTKHPEFEYVAELSNGRNWVDDDQSIVTKPMVRKSIAIHNVFQNIDRGATFTLKFGGPNTRPKNINYFQAETAMQWLFLLLVKTPLGNIDLFHQNKFKTEVNIIVIASDGNETSIINESADFLFPHLKIPASVNLKEIIEAQQKLIDQGHPTKDLPLRFQRLNGIYEFFSNDEIKKLPTERFESDHEKLVNEYQVTAYGYFCYSTSVLDELSDNILGLRRGSRIIKGGLQMANNFMIQGDLILIPLTSNIGYQNQAFIIVHFLNADPDLGRKGFQPELKELAETISIGIVNRFKRWRTILKIDTGSRPSISSSDTVFNWITEQIKYESEHPLKISNPNFFIPINEVSITSIPQSEQDVIVLFNQLIAGGVIRGLKLLATDQKQQYDGVFKFYIKQPIQNHLYHQTNNPLGVLKLENRENYNSRPFILEYKFSFDALIREFENEEKKENEINLVVAWEMGELWLKNYQITSLLDLENLHHREFHGLTHVFNSSFSKFYGIILSELIDYLNDLDNSQKFQKEKYQNQ